MLQLEKKHSPSLLQYEPVCVVCSSGEGGLPVVFHQARSYKEEEEEDLHSNHHPTGEQFSQGCPPGLFPGSFQAPGEEGAIQAGF